ncbi:MAG: bifunctional indole-3-glycerol phosphate synthase/phosphoribosylanthranilate isomerase [Planctomycetota bacterium]|jgi:indole-3-glycerol phosphate synthase/phosphoribosylanthranilate isomerase|nr:bifunctional indole-3-glycerol phosphate synthase/phosphoribosylanthranilate isomerase [Planctomycetota bacterium]
MAKSVRDEIVAKRRSRVASLGHAEGADLPAEREAPLVPFLGSGGLICEIKRRSPSKGDIAAGLDAAERAGAYIRAGAANLSVLTEPEGFGGSLADLLRVKQAHPRVAALRKDFLFDPEDIDVSWRAGADAVLLIAGMLPGERLAALHARALSFGMRALVEVHDREDIRKAAAFSPDLVGINSRDLASFAIDPLLPPILAAGIGWPASLVYESGIAHPEQAAFAAACGFKGLLVGEAVMRRPELIGRIAAALRETRRDAFWPALARRLFNRPPGRPLVKICGLTSEADARLAADCGADLLGFVFWPGSPRRADPACLRRLGDVGVLKIGVVVNPAGSRQLPPEVRELLTEGRLDALQLHGQEEPDDCRELWPAYYKALRPGRPEDLAEKGGYRSPRLLLDASAARPGGSGRRVAEAILDAWKGPLWLAGGLDPDNVRAVAAGWRPELVDVASGVEAAPGRKDAGKLRRFFAEIDGIRTDA